MTDETTDLAADFAHSWDPYDNIEIEPEPSVRSAWYRVTCRLCDWTTTGMEPVVEDAGRGHVSSQHDDVWDGDGPAAEEATDHLERVAGPAVTVRIATEHGPHVTVEWADKPSPGEVVVVTQALMERRPEAKRSLVAQADRIFPASAVRAAEASRIADEETGQP